MCPMRPSQSSSTLNSSRPADCQIARRPPARGGAYDRSWRSRPRLEGQSHKAMPPNVPPSPEVYPVEARWFESTSGRVHYVDEGTGRPLLLLHGNPTWSFLYRHLIQRVRGCFRCVAMDYPGFGLSDRPLRYAYTP